MKRLTIRFKTQSRYGYRYFFILCLGGIGQIGLAYPIDGQLPLDPVPRPVLTELPNRILARVMIPGDEDTIFPIRQTSVQSFLKGKFQ